MLTRPPFPNKWTLPSQNKNGLEKYASPKSLVQVKDNFKGESRFIDKLGADQTAAIE